MKKLHKLIILTIGSTVQGLAMAFFLFPHFIPSGGAAGFAVIFNHVWEVPFAWTIWCLNAILLLMAIKWLGLGSASWTMFCVSVTAITINVVSIETLSPLNYVIVDLILGAVFFGIGLGILFRFGASSGGIDILALIICKIRNSKPGKTLFYINGTILLATGLLMDWKIILYAIISQFIATRVVDIVVQFRFKLYNRVLAKRVGAKT
ncbi:YitT family protein [Bacillus alkalisoli]|uniref:YitT family protein n=1 Tax=Bacillus alkalisoli TaxID=2011008 RepID=UPI000C24E34E|nr:YitT family protein [Bacillus alkalisoli]